MIARGVVCDLACAQRIVARVALQDCSFEQRSSIRVDDDSSPGIEVVDALADLEGIVVELLRLVEGVTRGATGLDQSLNGFGNKGSNEGCRIRVWHYAVEVDYYDSKFVDVVGLAEERAPEETEESHDSHRQDEILYKLAQGL